MMSFTALAEPTRFRIVEMLAKNGGMAAGQIGSRFDVSAAAISQHLKVLKDANLVRVETRAQQRIYSLNTAGIAEIEDWAGHVRATWEARFDALDAFLKEEVKKSKTGRRKKL